MTQFIYNRNTTRHGHRIKSHLTTPGQPKLQLPHPAPHLSCHPRHLPGTSRLGLGHRPLSSGLVALAGWPAFCRCDSRIDMSLMLHFGSRSSFRSSLAISIWVGAKQCWQAVPKVHGAARLAARRGAPRRPTYLPAAPTMQPPRARRDGVRRQRRARRGVPRPAQRRASHGAHGPAPHGATARHGAARRPPGTSSLY